MALSRRKFIEAFGAAALAGLAARASFPFDRLLSGGVRDFHFLVIGDSLIAGQGLREEDRFYTLTADWLKSELAPSGGRVFLKNKSHSGSNVYLNEEEKKALEAADRPDDKFYHPEVNFSFPSISTQVRVAAEEYAAAGVAGNEVDLVMVSGGITNISVKSIINPFEGEDELRRDIVKYCNGYMSRLLAETAEAFPRATIAVIGYYPMVSPKSSTGMIYNAVLELYDFPGPVKPVMNNLLTKQFFKVLHAKMTKRSRIWTKGSERELKSVVDAHNRSGAAGPAVYVPAPIDESNCFGTKNSLLWKMGKKGRSEDDLYDLRQNVCDEAIESVKDVGVLFKKRFCELSGLGHPNPEGARAYAESIRKELRPVFSERYGFGQVRQKSAIFSGR